MASTTAHPPSLAQSALRRPLPEVGAVCGKAARTDLCGGCEATRIPTATAAKSRNDDPACRALHAGYEERGGKVMVSPRPAPASARPGFLACARRAPAARAETAAAHRQ